MRRQKHVGLCSVLFFHRGIAYNDKPPASVDPSPWSPTKRATDEEFGFAKIEQDAERLSLDEISRWQQNRLLRQSTLRAIEHGDAGPQGTDEQLQLAREERHQRYNDALAFEKSLSEVQKKRQLINTASPFEMQFLSESEKKDLLQFPERRREEEEADFQRRRSHDITVATPSEKNTTSELVRKPFTAGNLTAVAIGNWAKPPLPERAGRPRQKTRHLISNIPTSRPFESVSLSEGFSGRPAASTEVVDVGQPKASHEIVPHVLSSKALDTSLTPRERAQLVAEDDDILLRTHSHFKSALNLNSYTKTLQPTESSVLKEAISKEANSPEKSSQVKGQHDQTLLERQRYMDVLQTQRQAEITSALKEARSFERNMMKMEKKSQLNKILRGGDAQSAYHADAAAAHDKFSPDQSAKLKQQHEYLQQLLSCHSETSGGEVSMTSGGVQWIGTTPTTFTNKVFSFSLHVLGSAVLLAVLYTLNPGAFREKVLTDERNDGSKKDLFWQSSEGSQSNKDSILRPQIVLHETAAVLCQSCEPTSKKTTGWFQRATSNF